MDIRYFKFGKKKLVGDHIVNHEICPDIPKGTIICTKGNKNGQIEDVSPRFVGKVDLFSKYYHRDARAFVGKYIAEVIDLLKKEACDD